MLRLEGQSLRGSLPVRLKSLEYLYLGVSNRSDMIPPALYNLSSAIELVFTANHLSGNFMSNIRFSFPQLRRFAIAQNQFRGIIGFYAFLVIHQGFGDCHGILFPTERVWLWHLHSWEKLQFPIYQIYERSMNK